MVDLAKKSKRPPFGTVLDPFEGAGVKRVSALKNGKFLLELILTQR